MGVPNDTLWGICGKEESMALRGNYARKADSTQYAISQVKSIVKALGLHETSEANNNLLMYCPFHSNRHTASFSISCENGAWLCYNPACGESGNLVELVKRILHKNDFEALRFISSKQNEALENFDELLEGLMEDKPEFAQDVERQVREKLSAGVEVSATKVVPEEIEPEDDEVIVEDF